MAETEKFKDSPEALKARFQEIFSQVTAIFTEKNIEYNYFHHEPTLTSEDSSRARGCDLANGAKAIIVKISNEFCIFVLSASKKIDFDVIKAKFRIKKVRFATPKELLNLTGLVPGSVPPFGFPILPLKLYVDSSILTRERLFFNIGSLTDSISITTPDYLKMMSPEIFSFSVE